MKNYVLHQIPLMYTEMPLSVMTYLWDYNQIVRAGHFVWFIEGLRQNILVDAGMTLEEDTTRGFKGTNIQSLEEGLGKLGLKFDDIDTIILTHSDHDHLALAHKFTRAKVIIQKAELEFARNPHPWYQTLRAVRYPHFSKLIEGLRFEVVEGDVKIDDGLDIIYSPGHTPGGQSVAVRTSQGTAIITGWCCVDECFEPSPELKKKGLKFFMTSLHTNPLQLYDTISKVISRADILIPVHGIKRVNQPTIP